MTYLKVKRDKKLVRNKFKNKVALVKLISENQLFTLKEFYKLKNIYFNLSMEDVTPIKLKKNQVSNYWGSQERYQVDDVPLPF